MFVTLRDDIIFHLRLLAIEKKPIKEMLLYLIDELCVNSDSRILVIAYFKKAFCLTVFELSMLGAWNYFDGGTWGDKRIEDTLQPLMNERRWEMQ